MKKAFLMQGVLYALVLLMLMAIPLSCSKETKSIIEEENPEPDPPEYYYKYQGEVFEIKSVGAEWVEDWLPADYYFYTVVFGTKKVGYDNFFKEFTGSGKSVELYLHRDSKNNLSGTYIWDPGSTEDFVITGGYLRISGTFGDYDGEKLEFGDGNMSVSKDGDDFVVNFMFLQNGDTVLGKYKGPISYYNGNDNW